MEETCAKAIIWVIIGAVWLFIIFHAIKHYLEQRNLAELDRILLMEKLDRIEETLYRIEDDQIKGDRKENTPTQYAAEKTAVSDVENKVIEDNSNIFLANDIANILREGGLTLDYRFFSEPSNGQRLEHIFALVREMLRTY